MGKPFLLAAVLATSLVAVVIGVRGLGLAVRDLRPAVDRMLQGVGASLIFAGLNLVTALALIFLARSVTGAFVSNYRADDLVLLVLSLLQGLVVQSWWGARTGKPLAARSSGGPDR